MPALEHSLLLHDLDDGAVAALVRVAGAGSDSPLAVLQGASPRRRVRVAARRRRGGRSRRGALPAVRARRPAAPGLAEAVAGTFARLDAELAPHTSGRTVPNFLGAHGGPSRARPAATVERLRSIRRLRDPQGTIRSNRPVIG